MPASRRGNPCGYPLSDYSYCSSFARLQPWAGARPAPTIARADADLCRTQEHYVRGDPCVAPRRTRRSAPAKKQAAEGPPKKAAGMLTHRPFLYIITPKLLAGMKWIN